MPPKGAKHGDGSTDPARARAVEFIDTFDANTLRVMCKQAGAPRFTVLTQMRPFLVDVQVLGLEEAKRKHNLSATTGKASGKRKETETNDDDEPMDVDEEDTASRAPKRARKGRTTAVVPSSPAPPPNEPETSASTRGRRNVTSTSSTASKSKSKPSPSKPTTSVRPRGLQVTVELPPLFDPSSSSDAEDDDVVLVEKPVSASTRTNSKAGRKKAGTSRNRSPSPTGYPPGRPLPRAKPLPDNSYGPEENAEATSSSSPVSTRATSSAKKAPARPPASTRSQKRARVPRSKGKEVANVEHVSSAEDEEDEDAEGSTDPAVTKPIPFSPSKSKLISTPVKAKTPASRVSKTYSAKVRQRRRFKRGGAASSDVEEQDADAEEDQNDEEEEENTDILVPIRDHQSESREATPAPARGRARPKRSTNGDNGPSTLATATRSRSRTRAGTSTRGRSATRARVASSTRGRSRSRAGAGASTSRLRGRARKAEPVHSDAAAEENEAAAPERPRQFDCVEIPKFFRRAPRKKETKPRKPRVPKPKPTRRAASIVVESETEIGDDEVSEQISDPNDDGGEYQDEDDDRGIKRRKLDSAAEPRTPKRNPARRARSGSFARIQAEGSTSTIPDSVQVAQADDSTTSQQDDDDEVVITEQHSPVESVPDSYAPTLELLPAAPGEDEEPAKSPSPSPRATAAPRLSLASSGSSQPIHSPLTHPGPHGSPFTLSTAAQRQAGGSPSPDRLVERAPGFGSPSPSKANGAAAIHAIGSPSPSKVRVPSLSHASGNGKSFMALGSYASDEPGDDEDADGSVDGENGHDIFPHTLTRSSPKHGPTITTTGASGSGPSPSGSPTLTSAWPAFSLPLPLGLSPSKSSQGAPHTPAMESFPAPLGSVPPPSAKGEHKHAKDLGRPLVRDLPNTPIPAQPQLVLNKSPMREELKTPEPVEEDVPSEVEGATRRHHRAKLGETASFRSLGDVHEDSPAPGVEEEPVRKELEPMEIETNGAGEDVDTPVEKAATPAEEAQIRPEEAEAPAEEVDDPIEEADDPIEEADMLDDRQVDDQTAETEVLPSAEEATPEITMHMDTVIVAEETTINTVPVAENGVDAPMVDAPSLPSSAGIPVPPEFAFDEVFDIAPVADHDLGSQAQEKEERPSDLMDISEHSDPVEEEPLPEPAQAELVPDLDASVPATPGELADDEASAAEGDNITTTTNEATTPDGPAQDELVIPVLQDIVDVEVNFIASELRDGADPVHVAQLGAEEILTSAVDALADGDIDITELEPRTSVPADARGEADGTAEPEEPDAQGQNMAVEIQTVVEMESGDGKVLAREVVRGIVTEYDGMSSPEPDD